MKNLAWVLAVLALGQDADLEVSSLMDRVRERVKKTYVEMQGIAWTDTVREEALKQDRSPKKKPTESAYDMIIRLQPPDPGDTAGVPFYIREQKDLKLVNGKPTKKKNASGSYAAGVGAPLMLLLTGQRAADYAFSYAGHADLDGRRTLIVDFKFLPKTEPKVNWDKRFVGFGVRFKGSITGVPYTTGRIWVDPDTYDVLRFDWHSDPFEFERPRGRDKIVYQRDMTVRFKSMTFTNPDQTLLVPESTETVITFKGAKTPISRVIQSFSNYKRFTGDIQIAPAYSK